MALNKEKKERKKPGQKIKSSWNNQEETNVSTSGHR